jgi:ubiquinone/menaquinone biosynthesis C-methylase UbiE
MTDPAASSLPTESKFTLEKFAAHPFYEEVNRRLVSLTDLHQGQHVVDLGAGTGAVTRLLAEEVANDGAEVIAVEPSATAIEVARRNLGNMTGAVISFIQGSAEKLSSIVRGPVDAVFFCNAIHLIPEKEQVLEEIKQTLREDGTFVQHDVLSRRGATGERAILPQMDDPSAPVAEEQLWIMPDKTRTEARHQLSEDEYVQLLEENGFGITRKEVIRLSCR